MILRLTGHILRVLVPALLGALIALSAVYVAWLLRLPDTKPWHEIRLHSEFRESDAARVRTLDDYQKNEDRLFQELQNRIYQRVAPRDRTSLNRFSTGSRVDPLTQTPNWNRTFELAAREPRGGALLLHGLTDSPYAMRSLANTLHAAGYWVTVLRLPGHGTAPSGVAFAEWQDWAAATRLGARHVRAKVGPARPLVLVGFSTGAALAVEAALAHAAGERDDMPRIDRVVLLSPAIGVSPVAALASLQGRLAAIPGLRNAAWSDVVPEYNPYKYNSFPVNAADQIYRLTKRIGSRVATLAERAGGGIRGMPPILAFQSVADATVSARAVVDTLFRHLAPEGHELVLFDVNRLADTQSLLRPDALKLAEQLIAAGPQPFDLTLLTNESEASARVLAVRRRAGETAIAREPTGLEWPAGVVSLSHTALPYAPDDPIFGATRPRRQTTIYLGHPNLLGETGIVAIQGSELVRLRFNPHFAYVARRILEFVGAPDRPYASPIIDPARAERLSGENAP
jgi:alpha-beta hydrolase superfamily lysophospholipase